MTAEGPVSGYSAPMRMGGCCAPAYSPTCYTVAGMLLVRASERAERVAQALRCRGFEGRFQSLTTFRTRWPDVLFLAAVLLTAALVLAWDLLLR